MSRMVVRRRAILALVLVTVLWGLSFPTLKLASRIIESHHSNIHDQIIGQLATSGFFIAVRFAAAIVLMYLVMPWLFRELTPKQWLMGGIIGLVYGVGIILQVVGLTTISASRSAFLTSLAIVFTPFLVILVERRIPRLFVLAAIPIVFLGILLLTEMIEWTFAPQWQIRFVSEKSFSEGDCITMFVAFLFAIQIILIDQFGRVMPPAKLTPGMFLTAALLGIIVFLLALAMEPGFAKERRWLDTVVNRSFLFMILINSVPCTAAAFYLMNRYQPDVSPTQAAVIYTLEPLFASLWAAFVPGMLSSWLSVDYPSEHITMSLLTGGVFVLLGNALASMSNGSSIRNHE